MTKFVINQEVQVIVSNEFTTISRVFMTENGVRYNLRGRPVDVHYHDDMLQDARHALRLQKEAEERVLLEKKSRADRSQSDAQRAALNSSSNDSGAAMIATQVILHDAIVQDDTPSRSYSSSYSSGYDSSSSYSSSSSCSSSSSSDSGSSSSCD